MALKKAKEEKFIVPGWMVSFSDMIVNLMCFFILLNAMGSSQECGFAGAGKGDYMPSVLPTGKPGLMPSQRTLIATDYPQARYAAPHLKPLSGKDWVEHTLKTMHEEFDRISKANPKLNDPGKRFRIPIDVLFRANSTRLETKQKEELQHALPSLLSRQKDRVEVVGTCAPGEAGSLRDALELSFARARAVADYLIANGMPSDRLVPYGIGETSEAGEGDARGEGRRRVDLLWMLARP